MRLTKDQVQIIKEEVNRAFGADAEVWVFGSRMNEASRGGDIDLLIETDAPPEKALDMELRLYARLIRRLGEQRIDIVVHRADGPLFPIHQAARQTGERL